MAEKCTYPSGMKSALPTGGTHTDQDIDQGHRKLDFAGDALKGNASTGQATAENVRRTKAIVDMYPEGQE